MTVLGDSFQIMHFTKPQKKRIIYKHHMILKIEVKFAY